MKALRSIFILTALCLFADFTLSSCKQTTFDEQTAKEAEEYTVKQCPKKMAEGIILDSMTYAIPEKCLSYYYTLSGSLDNEQAIRKSIGGLRNQLLNEIKNSVELRRAKKHNVSFRYIYVSKSSEKTISEILIKKKDYED